VVFFVVFLGDLEVLLLFEVDFVFLGDLDVLLLFVGLLDGLLDGLLEGLLDSLVVFFLDTDFFVFFSDLSLSFSAFFALCCNFLRKAGSSLKLPLFRIKGACSSSSSTNLLRAIFR